MTTRSILPKDTYPALCALLLSAGAAGQELPAILEVQLENTVSYNGDVTDPAKIARNPGPVASLGAAELGNFWRGVGVGDITAVNGNAVKGTWVSELQALLLRPAPTPGQAIADVMRGSVYRYSYEFLKPDGTWFGSIFISGFVNGGNAITGGSGAFVGARGSMSVQGAPRVASQAEDPSMRRIHGGARQLHVFRIFPLFRPDVVIGANGPSVFHSDFSLVTAASPARAGETLIVYAKGLGPTAPAINPGDTFPSEPLAVATSPVEVLVNGKPAPAVNQIGVPRTTDTYRVDFRVPDDTPPGTAQVQIRAAWVPGAAVPAAVR